MAHPLKVLVLGCSAVTNGELLMVFDFLRRCRTPLTLSAAVGVPSVSLATWAGAQPFTYPMLGASRALTRLDDIFSRVAPDALVIADLLLIHGVSSEMGAALLPIIDHARKRCRVVALDLYDWDHTATIIDGFGSPLFPNLAPLAPGIGRLLPSPSLPPARSTPGRGHYAMMEDRGPLSAEERQRVRTQLGLPESPVVLLTTSRWQHGAPGQGPMWQKLVPSAPGGARVVEHFPRLLLRLMDHAGQQLGGLTLVHVGPHAFAPPAEGLRHLDYRFLNALEPALFERMLGAVDVYVSPNCPASTAVRAASLRVPVLTIHQGAGGAPQTGTSAPHLALRQYLDAVLPTYPWSMWPLGFHRVLARNLEGNPFAQTQLHTDVMQPDALVNALVSLIVDRASAQSLQHAQAQYFGQLAALVDNVDTALRSALDVPAACAS